MAPTSHRGFGDCRDTGCCEGTDLCGSEPNAGRNHDRALAHVTAARTQDDQLPRRAGVYLEPGEEATISATGSPLTLLVVSVPKHTAKGGMLYVFALP